MNRTTKFLNNAIRFRNRNCIFNTKTLLVLLIFGCLIGIPKSEAQSPGGINSNLTLWLKADAGIGETEGQSITTWTDQSPSGFDATNGGSGGATNPTVRQTTQTLNFNPTLEFDGVANALDLGTNHIFSANGATELSIFIVAKPDASGNPKFVYDFGRYADRGYGLIMSDNYYGAHASDNVGGAALAKLHTNGKTPSLAEVNYVFGDSMYVKADGRRVDSKPITLSHLQTGVIWEGNVRAGASSPVSIGAQGKSPITNRTFKGNMAEVIVYNNTPTGGMGHEKIRTYLGIKYGLPIQHNFYASDGSMIYNTATYGNDVAGIGKDNASGLHQKQSKSASPDGIVSMGLGTIAATNSANSNSISTDKNFLLWGNDNGAVTSFSQSDINITGEPQHERVQRIWKLNQTGSSIGNVLFRVDVDDPDLDVASLPGSATNYYVYLDNDGDFTNGGTTTHQLTNSSGSDWETTLSSAQRMGKSYFSIGMMIACTNPDVPTLSATSNNHCAGTSTTISVAMGDNLNDATAWHIYSGSCGGTAIASNSTGSFAVSPNSTTTYYVRGEGGCVTSGSCGMITVTIADAENPVAVCPTNTPILTLDGNGNATLAANALAGNSTDNCAVASETSPLTNFDCDDVGNQTVTLTVMDGSGNSNSKNCAVTIQDTQNPMAACPNTPPAIVIGNNGNGVLVANALAGNSTDNCSIIETSPMITFDCDDLGTQIVTLTATDASGNSHSVDCSVEIQDNIAPTINCKNITIQLNNSGTITIIPEDVFLSSSDNCAIETMAVNPNTFDCSNTGSNTVTLTVHDYAGNPDDCQAIVTVQDNAAPIAKCKSATIQLDVNGNATLTTADIDDNSTDDCGIASLALSKTSFDCSNTGSNQVVLTVMDNSGFSSTCSAIVLVEDNIDPIAKCKDFSTNCTGSQVTIYPSDINDMSSDNCGFSLSLDQPVLACSTSSVTVTLTATDDSGNTDNCTATVTINQNGGGMSISIDDVSKNEGSWWGVTVFKFTLTRSGGTGAASVDFATQDGTASSSPGFFNDYSPLNGTVNWSNGGSNTKTINVVVKRDNNAEPDENFFVNLSNPTGGASISDGQGEGLILNDDGQPVIGNDDNQTIFNQNVLDSEVELTIYPNPVKDIMTIQIGHIEKESQLKVFNLNGSLIWQQDLSGSNSTIEIPTIDWASGAYLVQWKGKGKKDILTQKVIVE